MTIKSVRDEIELLFTFLILLFSFFCIDTFIEININYEGEIVPGCLRYFFVFLLILDITSIILRIKLPKSKLIEEEKIKTKHYVFPLLIIVCFGLSLGIIDMAYDNNLYHEEVKKVESVNKKTLTIKEEYNGDSVVYEIKKPFLIKVYKGEKIKIRYKEEITEGKYVISSFITFTCFCISLFMLFFLLIIFLSKITNKATSE